MANNKKELSRAGGGVSSIWGTPKQQAKEETSNNVSNLSEKTKPTVSKEEIKKAQKVDNRNSGGKLVTKAFNLKSDTYEQLRKLAYESHRSASVIVNEVLSAYLEPKK